MKTQAYDPDSHDRRSIRLRGYDYAQAGAYFVTICTLNRECILGEIQNGKVELSTLGSIVSREWNDLPNRFSTVELDTFVIMPNHIHAVVVLTESVGTTLAVAQNDAVAQNEKRAGARPAPTKPTLGNVVGAFKSLCVTDWLKHIKQNNLNVRGKFWQRGYYEHIIRNEDDLNRIREYIVANPARWEWDRVNPRRGNGKNIWESHERIWFNKLVDGA